MKNILYMLILPILLIGCKKEDTDLTFGATPEERVSEILAEVKSTLVEAPNGWIVGMGTSGKGGYGFYISFSEDDKLKMLSDYSAASATALVESTYRVKWGSNASLIFDTYNYLTLMQDPVPGVAGGTAARGYQSDIEYNFDRISGDSVIFVGKKYLNPLILVKATQEQQSAYLNAGYPTNINKYRTFFSSNAFTKLAHKSKDYQISFDMTNKKVSSTNFSDAGSVATSASFYFSIDAIEVINGLIIDDIVIKRFKINSAGNLIAYDEANTEYPITVEAKPIFPFELYFKHNGVYNSIYTTGSVMPEGVVSDFNQLWAAQLANYQLNSVSMISMTFKLVDPRKAKLEVWFLSGTTQYLADASYDYVITGNTIKLSNYIPSVSNANWGNGWVTTAIKNYFIDAEFELAWVESSTSKSAMIGGLIKKGTPTSFYYGNVNKQ
ncbi:DUF4302 domain-containing protein [Sphingobacterium hungaricum]